MTWIYNEKWNRIEETNNDGKTKLIACMSGNNTDSKRDGVKIIESIFMENSLRKIVAKNYNEISELNKKLEQSEHMVETLNELVKGQDKDVHDYESEISTLNRTIDEYRSQTNDYESEITEAYDVIDSYSFIVKNYEGMD